MTGLKGPDGQVYAVAQGPAVLGGYVAGSGGNSQVVNHPTVGRIPNGAIIERAAPTLKIAERPSSATAAGRFHHGRAHRRSSEQAVRRGGARRKPAWWRSALPAEYQKNPPSSWPKWNASPSSPTGRSGSW